MTPATTNCTPTHVVRAAINSPASNGFCNRLVVGVASRIKQLGLGIASAAIISPLQISQNFLATYLGLIPEISVKDYSTVFATIEQLPRAKLEIVLDAPIFEELLCRGLLQDVLLTRLPKYILKKISPGSETILDSTIAKIARILFTSTAFSLLHLSNHGTFPDSVVSHQLVSGFTIGIALGIIKENIGLVGAIGTHIAHNSVAMITIEHYATP